MHTDTHISVFCPTTNVIQSGHFSGWALVIEKMQDTVALSVILLLIFSHKGMRSLLTIFIQSKTNKNIYILLYHPLLYGDLKINPGKLKNTKIA